MFNWYSAPTFAGMLLLWVMACYVLTRSPRSLVASTAVAAQVAGAAYLMGQGILANASTIEDWRSWADRLQWGALLAPTLWYWVTVLLLRDQKVDQADRYLQWVGYPMGVLLALGCAVLTAAIYTGNSLYGWDSPTVVPADQASYFRYRAPEGPLYPAFIAILVASMLGATINTWIGWRLPIDEQRRRRFAWLLVSAVLFILGTAPTAIANWLSVPNWPTWLGHLTIAAAAALLAANVAAYSMLFRGQALRTDLVYFLVATGAVCLLYALAFIAIGVQYSFRLLALLVVILILAILTHALVDAARRLLDRLFFGSDVRRFRSDLSAMAQDAALTRNLGTLLSQARNGLEEMSEERFIRLTEEALRRLNSPSALARCGLIVEIPLALTASCREDPPVLIDPTPLEQARCLRDVLVAAIEQLRPSEQDERSSAPAALQYHILREEYLLGMPNKQIMMRRAVSEGTFHRNRREAIAILASELRRQEDRLARERSGQPGT